MSHAPWQAGPLFAHGFSWRKRPWVRRFAGSNDVRFVRGARGARRVPAGAWMMLWGRAAVPAGLDPSVRVLRVEDGFLRSVGLGADLVAPLSWVIDSHGMHYEAAGQSDLERLLQNLVFPATLLERAASLRTRIVREGLSKYNLSDAAVWQRPSGVACVVLVVGQVERDAAIAGGSPQVCTNLALVKAARRMQPDAHLLYKPHPDVLAGLRLRGAQEDEVSRWCDEVVADVPIHVLLAQVDAVHVMTSLAGFEALLRGRQVVCHGLPFYAGWGLTQDCLPLPRRRHRRSLDELVAAALILYPRYIDPRTGALCEVEQAIDALLDWRERAPDTGAWWRRCLRPLLRRP